MTVANLTPTAAEMDAALVFTVDGYSDADGVDHVTAAVKAVGAAEAKPFDWDAAEAAFIVARKASDEATALEFEATSDLVPLHQPIHDAYLTARSRLMKTAAPHWAGIGMKAEAFLRMWGDDETSRYAQAAKSLADVAGKIGKVAPADAELIDVMAARGYAERLCYCLAHDEDGYRNWGCSVGGVGRIATEAEGLAEESRALAKATPAQQAMSGEIISAVWFGKSIILDAHEPPPPPTWDSALRVYGAAKEEANARGIEVDAAFAAGGSASEAEKDLAEKRYETALCVADAALEAIVDRPVETAEQLVVKHQLAADRWLLENIGETLSDPLFVERISSEKEATRWIMGRLHQDLQRLAGVESECDVGRQAARFAGAIAIHKEIDGEQGAVVEAECDAQWHTMIAAEAAAEAGTPTSRAGVAFQLLCAVGEIDTVENGRDDDAKEEAGEKIRIAVVNAIAALGLPHDAETARYFLGGRLAKRLAQ